MAMQTRRPLQVKRYLLQQTNGMPLFDVSGRALVVRHDPSHISPPILTILDSLKRTYQYDWDDGDWSYLTLSPDPLNKQATRRCIVSEELLSEPEEDQAMHGHRKRRRSPPAELHSLFPTQPANRPPHPTNPLSQQATRRYITSEELLSESEEDQATQGHRKRPRLPPQQFQIDSQGSVQRNAASTNNSPAARLFDRQEIQIDRLAQTVLPDSPALQIAHWKAEAEREQRERKDWQTKADLLRTEKEQLHEALRKTQAALKLEKQQKEQCKAETLRIKAEIVMLKGGPTSDTSCPTSVESADSDIDDDLNDEFTARIEQASHRVGSDDFEIVDKANQTVEERVEFVKNQMGPWQDRLYHVCEQVLPAVQQKWPWITIQDIYEPNMELSRKARAKGPADEEVLKTSAAHCRSEIYEIAAAQPGRKDFGYTLDFGAIETASTIDIMEWGPGPDVVVYDKPEDLPGNLAQPDLNAPLRGEICLIDDTSYSTNAYSEMREPDPANAFWGDHYKVREQRQNAKLTGNVKREQYGGHNLAQKRIAFEHLKAKVPWLRQSLSFIHGHNNTRRLRSAEEELWGDVGCDFIVRVKNVTWHAVEGYLPAKLQVDVTMQNGKMNPLTIHPRHIAVTNSRSPAARRHKESVAVEHGYFQNMIKQGFTRSALDEENQDVDPFALLRRVLGRKHDDEEQRRSQQMRRDLRRDMHQNTSKQSSDRDSSTAPENAKAQRSRTSRKQLLNIQPTLAELELFLDGNVQSESEEEQAVTKPVVLREATFKPLYQTFANHFEVKRLVESALSTPPTKLNALKAATSLLQSDIKKAVKDGNVFWSSAQGFIDGVTAVLCHYAKAHENLRITQASKRQETDLVAGELCVDVDSIKMHLPQHISELIKASGSFSWTSFRRTDLGWNKIGETLCPAKDIYYIIAHYVKQHLSGIESSGIVTMGAKKTIEERKEEAFNYHPKFQEAFEQAAVLVAEDPGQVEEVIWLFPLEITQYSGRIQWRARQWVAWLREAVIERSRELRALQ